MANRQHFFIVGAQRSGTTYLYRMLEQHPQICMARPARPEPKFFLQDLPVSAATRADYFNTFFAHSRGELVFGEKSTSYIESEGAAERIARHFPQAHIFFLLRNPVDRAISNYRFSKANGLEPLSFEAALDAEPLRLAQRFSTSVSVSPFAYVKRGHYANYLEVWRRHVSAERMQVFVSEDVLGHDHALRDVFARLGVQSDVALEGMENPVNGAGADLVVSEATRHRLNEGFRHSNQRLIDEYGLDLHAWD